MLKKLTLFGLWVSWHLHNYHPPDLYWLLCIWKNNWPGHIKLRQISHDMEMHECWRPSCVVPSLSVFLLKDVKWHHEVTLWCHVTSWRHAVMSYGVISHDKMNLYNLHKSHNQKVRKSCFSKWRPRPLTLSFKLLRDVIKGNVHIEFRVHIPNGSAVRVLTDRQTDRRDRFYTLDRWRGRE